MTCLTNYSKCLVSIKEDCVIAKSLITVHLKHKTPAFDCSPIYLSLSFLCSIYRVCLLQLYYWTQKVEMVKCVLFQKGAVCLSCICSLQQSVFHQCAFQSHIYVHIFFASSLTNSVCQRLLPLCPCSLHFIQVNGFIQLSDFVRTEFKPSPANGAVQKRRDKVKERQDSLEFFSPGT